MGPELVLGAVDEVERLLAEAVELGASDLHVDPTSDGATVTVRCDGVLRPIGAVSANLTPRVIGRLKSLAGLLVYRTDLPQEGRIPADRTGTGVEVRVATYPTLDGERAALRLDVAGRADLELEDLGLSMHAFDSLRHAIAQPHGVILLTGPSGSGKTTTLYACLRHLIQQPTARSIVTVEDPVERRIQGVTQTQVNPVAGLDFSRALRSLLRQDPEVLLVGEIRDRETASIALEAGLTGHLVASTVHAGTAVQVFSRLLEMGIEPFVLTTAVRGVLAQRLVRRRRDGPAEDGDEYEGRRLVAEWLPMSKQLRRAILDRGDGDTLLAAAREAGFRDLREESLALVRAGETTRSEVDRVLGDA